MVGDFCYSIETVAQNFNNARRVCFDQGGMLAEVPFSKGDFFVDMKKLFKSEIEDSKAMDWFFF